MSSRWILGWLAASLLVAGGAAFAARPVPGSDPAFPRLKYADSLVSVNDRCIVAKRKLSSSVRPVYVNRKPIGFC